MPNKFVLEFDNYDINVDDMNDLYNNLDKD